MKYFAIRDDDTSFFTNSDELESVYNNYWGYIPISLAVIPFAVSNTKDKNKNIGEKSTEFPIGDNKKLVTWLRKKIALGHIKIMLHGYNHEYKFIENKWIAEYKNKTLEQLTEETKIGKNYLEQLLNVEIDVFVPPSNSIGKNGIKAIRNVGLNLSGIMGLGGDRPLSLDYVNAYIKRWSWRILVGDAYPFELNFGGINELRAYALTPQVDHADLIKQLNFCSKINAPFVIATHYWEINKYRNLKKTLDSLVCIARKNNYNFNTLFQSK